MATLTLASASPRRRDLLEEAGYTLVLAPTHGEEAVLPGEAPAALVARLAQQKAHEALAAGGLAHTIIAADTVVAIDGDILGKPATAAAAHAMLAELSGRTHTVYTGVCLLRGTDAGGTREAPEEVSFVDATQVTFYPLDNALIERYIASGEPFDKAGAYGIQGKGKLLVERVEGNYETVVGLPLARVVRALAAWKESPWD
jgi:septum formation protein